MKGRSRPLNVNAMPLSNKSFALLVLASLSAVASAAPQVIHSNANGGDTIVGYGASGNVPNNGAALNTAPGWYYNNVRDDSTAGINTTHARLGNGSFAMTGVSSNSKADLEYYSLNTAGNFASGYKSLGTLNALSSLSYDWYRDASSTVAGHLMPSIRVMFDADGDFSTTNDRGYLVYERVYNGNAVGGTPVETNQWVHDDLFDIGGTRNEADVWMSKAGANEHYDRTFADWASGSYTDTGFPTLGANTAIYGFNLGFGSGWSGTFNGAVDNVSIGFNGSLTSYNFEAAGVPSVPGPLAVAPFLLGLAGRRLHRKRA